MRFDAYFFDFDGVLAASEPFHHRCYNQVLAESGQALDYAEFRARYVHLDDVSLFRTLATDRGLGWDEAAVRDFARRAQATFLAGLDRDMLYPGMAELVQRLSQDAPLAVVSMGDRAMIDRALELAGIADCFDVIVSPADVTRPKPDPEPYALARRRLEARRGLTLAPARCLAIEDSQGGVRSGHAAGLTVAALTHNQSAEALQAAGARHVLASVVELSAWLHG